VPAAFFLYDDRQNARSTCKNVVLSLSYDYTGNCLQAQPPFESNHLRHPTLESELPRMILAAPSTASA